MSVIERNNCLIAKEWSRQMPGYVMAYRAVLSACVLLVSLLIAACGVSTPATGSPSAIDELRITVTRYDYTVSPPNATTLFNYVTGDSATIRAVQNDLLTIPIVNPNANFNCPAGLRTYESYMLDFLDNGTGLSSEHASVNLTGCPFWTMLSASGRTVRLGATTNFWDRLRQATGAPVPASGYYP